MKLEVRIVPSAERDMDKLPTKVHERITQKILSLEDRPRHRGVRKLSGRDEYRLRVGDYRILYTIDDKNAMITIFAVGHRSDVYK